MRDKVDIKVVPVGGEIYECGKLVEPETLEEMNKAFNKDVKDLRIKARLQIEDDEYVSVTSLEIGGVNSGLFPLDTKAIGCMPCLQMEANLMIEAIEEYILSGSEEVYHNVENTTIKHTPEQMKEIMKGVEEGVDVFSYADVTNTPEQMRQMREELLKNSK